MPRPGSSVEREAGVGHQAGLDAPAAADEVDRGRRVVPGGRRGRVATAMPGSDVPGGAAPAASAQADVARRLAAGQPGASVVIWPGGGRR